MLDYVLRLAALSALLLPAVCGAWGPDGHMAVGAIADSRLAGTAAGRKVAALLRSGETLQVVSVWADCAKGVRPEAGKLTYRPDNVSFPECTPFNSAASEFERFVTTNWTQCGLPHGKEYCHHQYHYADVAIQRSRYIALAETGTSDHDIVQAINACIAKLQDRPVPSPFVFADKREALMLLTHYVGDIHQPLHVGSVYLDQHGVLLDPDTLAYDPDIENAGGNALRDPSFAFHPGTKSQPPFALHSEWDAIPPTFAIGGARWPRILAAAADVRKSDDAVITWASQWATDTLAQAGMAYAGLTYEWNKEKKYWSVIGIDEAYKARAEDIQAAQLAKAGARLASLLQQLFGP